MNRPIVSSSKRLTSRGGSADGLKPEDSVPGGFSKEKNSARRNAASPKYESTARIEDRRYLPESRTRVRNQKSLAEGELETPKETSGKGFERRTSRSRTDDTILTQTGPSVFSSNVEYSRSRTGRKIQNPLTPKEGEKSRADSRRWEISRVRTTSPANIQDFDTIAVPQPLESSSVRVDIPLSIDRTEGLSPNAEAPATKSFSHDVTSSGRGSGRSRQSSRTIAGRDESRISESETASGDVRVTGRTRSSLRRNSKTASTEAGPVEDTPRSRVGRGRGRRIEEVSRTDEASSTRSNQEADGRSHRSRGREPERQITRSRTPGRTANRKSPDVTTETPSTTTVFSTSTVSTTTSQEQASEEPEIMTKAIETPTTVSIPVTETFQKLETTTNKPEARPETRSSRVRSRANAGPRRSQGERDNIDGTQTRRVSSRGELRERGRQAATTSSSLKENENQAPSPRRRFNGGSSTKEPKIARTVLPEVSSSLNPLRSIPVFEVIDESDVAKRSTSSSLEGAPKRRGLKRLNIKPKDDKEELSTASSIKSTETLNGNGRGRGRGSGKSSAAKKQTSEEEEDNYPPEFKARLAQLVSATYLLRKSSVLHLNRTFFFLRFDVLFSR